MMDRKYSYTIDIKLDDEKTIDIIKKMLDGFTDSIIIKQNNNPEYLLPLYIETENINGILKIVKKIDETTKIQILKKIEKYDIYKIIFDSFRHYGKYDLIYDIIEKCNNENKNIDDIVKIIDLFDTNNHFSLDDLEKLLLESYNISDLCFNTIAKKISSRRDPIYILCRSNEIINRISILKKLIKMNFDINFSWGGKTAFSFECKKKMDNYNNDECLKILIDSGLNVINDDGRCFDELISSNNNSKYLKYIIDKYDENNIELHNTTKVFLFDIQKNKEKYKKFFNKSTCLHCFSKDIENIIVFYICF